MDARSVAKVDKVDKRAVIEKILLFAEPYRLTENVTKDVLVFGEYVFNVAIPLHVHYRNLDFDVFLQHHGAAKNMTMDVTEMFLFVKQMFVHLKTVAHVMDNANVKLQPTDDWIHVIIAKSESRSSGDSPVIHASDRRIKGQFDRVVVHGTDRPDDWTWLLGDALQSIGTISQAAPLDGPRIQVRSAFTIATAFLRIVWKHGLWAIKDASRLKNVLSQAYDLLWTNGPDALDIIASDIMYNANEYENYMLDYGYRLVQIWPSSAIMVGNWRHVIKIDRSRLVGEKINSQWWWVRGHPLGMAHTFATFVNEQNDIQSLVLETPPQTPDYLIIWSNPT